jgi:hypothetical protein
VWNGEWTDRQHGRIQVPQPPMTEHSRHKQPFRAKQIWKRKPITVSHPKQIQNRTAAEIRAWSCRSQQICRRTRNPKPRKAKQAVQPPERSISTTTQPSHDGEKMRSKTKWVEEANRTQKRTTTQITSTKPRTQTQQLRRTRRRSVAVEQKTPTPMVRVENNSGGLWAH